MKGRAEADGKPQRDEDLNTQWSSSSGLAPGIEALVSPVMRSHMLLRSKTQATRKCTIGRREDRKDQQDYIEQPR